MKRELVSVVTPCYNGEKYIGRFLDSILAQTYLDIELVIINDGSTDRTEDVIDTFRSKFEDRGIRLIYEYQENAGQAAALNRGLKLFTGEYLLWMDSDDKISPDFISARTEYLRNNPEKAYCYGKAVCISENDSNIISEIGKRPRNERMDFFEDVIASKDVFFSGYMCRTEKLDRVISDRDIYAGQGGQNAQLLLPLAWYYGEPGYVESSAYYYYIRLDSHSHSQNTSEKIINQLHRYEKILVSTIERIPDPEAQKYIIIAQKKYAKMRFGNAVDTKNAAMIKRYFKEILSLGIVNIHDVLMLIKYAGPFIKRG